jgi:predicted MFS family arabinose efflux permease
MAGGFLCLISWQTTFLIYLLGLIPLIAVLFAFKEPEFTVNEKDKPRQKVKIPVMIWLLFILFLLTQVFQYPTFVYLSQFMAEANLGDSAIAGTLLSVITVAGIVIALVFGVIYRALGKLTLPVSAICVAAGEVLIYLACVSVSLPIMIAAVVVFGIGATIMMAALSQEVSRLVNKATAGVALGLLFAFMNAGTFAATPYTQAIASGGSLLTTMIVGPIALVVIGIIFAVVTFTAKPESNIEG